ncbi:hypothetical protein ACIRD8_28625 [Streptomyces sp. NPDC102451]|uniref:hypothetical protein n=1 Tax=Streptomyces sp. NPDC102451 TaxID=3366177 RepID=UPI0037F5AAAB
MTDVDTLGEWKAVAKGKKTNTTPDKITVEVLGAADAKRLGASAVLKVERADDTKRSAPVRLQVDSSSFAEGYGGSYGSRLRLVELPPCAAVGTPGSKACPAEPKILPTIRSIGYPILYNEKQPGLKEVFTEREPCQKRPRCEAWLGNYFKETKTLHHANN